MAKLNKTEKSIRKLDKKLAELATKGHKLARQRMALETRAKEKAAKKAAKRGTATAEETAPLN